MQATLDQIRSLERLYTEGYEDSFLDRALHKIINHQLTRDQADFETLKNDLESFERRYRMDSSTFFSQYNAGLLGDEADLVEWSALYKMYTRLRARLNILRGAEG